MAKSTETLSLDFATLTRSTLPSVEALLLEEHDTQVLIGDFL
jgi:hypothetical protein